MDIELNVLELLGRLIAVGRGFRDGIVCAEDFKRFAAACGSVCWGFAVRYAFLLLLRCFFFLYDKELERTGGDAAMFEGRGCFGLGARRVLSVPGVGDDDVVEGRMALAEARETDFENHGKTRLMCYLWLYCGDYLSPLQKMMAFAMREQMPRTAIPRWLRPSTFTSRLLHIPFTLSLCLSLSLAAFHFQSQSVT